MENTLRLFSTLPFLRGRVYQPPGSVNFVRTRRERFQIMFLSLSGPKRPSRRLGMDSGALLGACGLHSFPKREGSVKVRGWTLNENWCLNVQRSDLVSL